VSKAVTKRKVTFGGASSLDNFIARKDGGFDWLMWTREVREISNEYWKTIDTVLMGRKTFEVALKFGSGAYPGAKNYVFSRTLKEKFDGVEVVSEDAATFVKRLKKEKGKGICLIGGGLLAKSLFEADLIDEIGLNIHPVLISSGIPLFYDIQKQINLKLIECRELKNGCVLVRYKVKKARVTHE
jgi:dihydrofolate reductase